MTRLLGTVQLLDVNTNYLGVVDGAVFKYTYVNSILTGCIKQRAKEREKLQ